MTRHAANQTIFNLSHYGLIHVAGDDAKKMLQGQLTCHLDEVSTTHSRLAAHCNPQGRVLSFFRVILSPRGYFLMTEKSMITQSINYLKKYALFYKVQIADESEQYDIYGINVDQPHLLHDLTQQSGVTIINIHEPCSRYIIISDKKLALTNELTAKDYIYWKHIDINQLLPTIHPETSGKFLPHEIGLHHHNAISLSKGCYTGQEIIARMHYRGKLKSKIYRAAIRINTHPTPGSDIYFKTDNEIKPCGTLVDVCQEGYHNYIALILTSDENAMNDHLFLLDDHSTFFTILI